MVTYASHSNNEVEVKDNSYEREYLITIVPTIQMAYRFKQTYLISALMGPCVARIWLSTWTSSWVKLKENPCRKQHNDMEHIDMRDGWKKLSNWHTSMCSWLLAMEILLWTSTKKGAHEDGWS